MRGLTFNWFEERRKSSAGKKSRYSTSQNGKET